MKNDKMQMSYVPQTTEHKLITVDGTTDFTLPHGCLVEDVVVVVKALDTGAGPATLNIGTTGKVGNAVAAANYYRATALDVDSGSPSGAVGVYGIDAAKMMDSVADNRVVRITTAGITSSVAEIYVWVNYRFAPSTTTPTRVA